MNGFSFEGVRRMVLVVLKWRSSWAISDWLDVRSWFWLPQVSSKGRSIPSLFSYSQTVSPN